MFHSTLLRMCDMRVCLHICWLMSLYFTLWLHCQGWDNHRAHNQSSIALCWKNEMLLSHPSVYSLLWDGEQGTFGKRWKRKSWRETWPLKTKIIILLILFISKLCACWGGWRWVRLVGRWRYFFQELKNLCATDSKLSDLNFTVLIHHKQAIRRINAVYLG